MVALGALGWHDGPGAKDFPGHAALWWTLKEQFAVSPLLPLWTSDWYAGASLVMAYLHPLFSLGALSPFASVFGVDLGLRIGATVFTVVAALTMYAWCLSCTGSRRGAAIGSAIYALHPSVFVFVGTTGHVHQPVSMAIVPLFFLAWRRLADRPDASRVIATSVVCALLFYDMQRFWMIAPFAGVVYLARVLSAPDAERLRSLGAPLAVALVLGALVLFPALPGLLEADGLRWHQPLSIEVYRERHSLPALWSLLDRGGMMAAANARADSAGFAALPGQWYQGAIALAFVAVGTLGALGRGWQRVRGGWLGVALGIWVCALALAFGVHAAGSPLAALRAAPIATGFAVLFVAVAFAAVRSVALQRWPTRRVWINASLACAVLLFVFVPPFPWVAQYGWVYERMRAPAHFAFPLLGFALGTAAAALMPVWDRWVPTPRRAAFTLAVIVLIALDVAPYAVGSRGGQPEGLLDEARRAFGSLREKEEGRLLDTRQYDPLSNRFGVIEGDRELAWGWLGWSSQRHTSEFVVDGIYGALRQAENSADPRDRARSMDTAAGLASLAHVRFVSRLVSNGPPLPDSGHFVPVWQGPGVELFENPNVLPRLQFYPQLALVSGESREVLPVVARLALRGVASYTISDQSDDALPAGLEPAFAFGRRATQLAPAALPAQAALERAVGPAEGWIYFTKEAETGRLVANCNAPTDGYLVLAESWSPRWKAVVGSELSQTLRMNHAFQGIRYLAGARRVEFRYRAGPSIAGSLWITVLSWVGVSVATFLAFIRRSQVL